MSIERLQRKDGVVWRVRWRDEQGRNRSKVLGRKRDAEAFDAEVRRLKRTRELGRLDAGKQTLADFGAEWWQLHAAPNLAPRTQKNYAWTWDKYVLPRLGDVRLGDLTPEGIHRYRIALEADGVGLVVIAKTLTLLHGVLARAVEWGRLTSNPAAGVRKPRRERTYAVRPLPPATIERMRAWFLERDRHRDATLLTVLAYSGLRPGEALALTWAHVGERTLLVEAAMALGEIRTTKTGRSRTVRLLAPLADDLAQWRRHSSPADDSALVFPGVDGAPWTHTAWQNWRTRAFDPAVKRSA